MEGVGLRVKNEGSGIKGGGWSYIYLRSKNEGWGNREKMIKLISATITLLQVQF